MDEVLKKLSSYNIFNYLVPGAAFAVLAELFTSYNFVYEDLIIGLFIYYVIGLVISRVGSLLLEPFLVWIGFVSFESGYLDAEARDEKLPILSEQNNMYRTLSATALMLAITIAYDRWIGYRIPNEIEMWGGILILFFLFLFAYQKQSQYIGKRINANNKND